MQLNSLEQSAFDEVRILGPDAKESDLLNVDNQSPARLEESRDNLIMVGSQTVLRMANYIQWSRADLSRLEVSKKLDLTKVTNIDINAQNLARNFIQNAFPDHVVSGEEDLAGHESQVDPSKYTWSFDSIDGTNTFLSQENTSAILGSLFKDGKTIFSIVCNPFTGELFYAFGDDNSRLITQSGFGFAPVAHDLPVISGDSAKFVNLQPRPSNYGILEKLMAEKKRRGTWLSKTIQTGGSPGWNMASVSKNPSFAYVHAGGQQKTAD